MKLYQEFLIGQEDNVIKEVNVSGAIILKMLPDGTKSILIIKRSSDDHWPGVEEFPRGKCHIKENLEECLKREVKEETGLDIEIIEYIDKYEYLADGGKRKSIQYNFLCKMKNPNQEIKLSKEHSEYRWISTVGQIELIVPVEMKKTISKVLNIDQQIVNYSKTDRVIKETQRTWLS